MVKVVSLPESTSLTYQEYEVWLVDVAVNTTVGSWELLIPKVASTSAAFTAALLSSQSEPLEEETYPEGMLSP